MIDWIALLGIFGFSILLQALFAGYETGFISLNRIRVRYLAEEEKRPVAIRLLHYVNHPDPMLTTLLVGTNIAMVVATVTVTRQVGSELFATLLVSPVVLVFAEIIPKTVFRAHPTRLSLALMPVIQVFYILIWPVVMPITVVIRLLLRGLRVANEEGYVNPLMSSLEDMRMLVDESAANGTIEPEEQEMIHSVIDLEKKQAKEIMIPRIDMKALPETVTRSELVALFEETGCTRIPVYRESIDEVIGVVNAFDLLLDAEPGNEDIGRFVREVMHVPDTMNADALLKKLRDNRQHLAIVTDEYGGTDGLITVEDILEEIFGEIFDEYDQDARRIQKVGADAYVVDARVPLMDASEFTGVRLDDEDVETVGGWVMHLAQRIPARGAVIESGRFRVTVLEADRTTVSRIRLEIRPVEPEPAKDAQEEK